MSRILELYLQPNFLNIIKKELENKTAITSE